MADLKMEFYASDEERREELAEIVRLENEVRKEARKEKLYNHSSK